MKKSIFVLTILAMLSILVACNKATTAQTQNGPGGNTVLLSGATQVLVGIAQGSLQSSCRLRPTIGISATAIRSALPSTSIFTVPEPNSALLPAPSQTSGNSKFAAK